MNQPISIIFAPNGSTRNVRSGVVDKFGEAATSYQIYQEAVQDIADTPEKVLNQFAIAHQHGASMLHIHARLVGEIGQVYDFAGTQLHQGDPWCDYRFYREVAHEIRAKYPDVIMDLSASRTGLKNIWQQKGDIVLAGGAPYTDAMSLTNAADIPRRKVGGEYHEAEPYPETQRVMSRSVLYLHDLMLSMGIEPSFEIQHERMFRTFEEMIQLDAMKRGDCVVQLLFGQQQGFPTFNIEKKKHGIYDPSPMKKHLDTAITICNPRVLGVSAGDIKSHPDFKEFVTFAANYRHPNGRMIDTIRVGYEHVGPVQETGYYPGNAPQVEIAAKILQENGRSLRNSAETRQLYNLPLQRKTYTIARERFEMELQQNLGDVLPDVPGIRR